MRGCGGEGNELKEWIIKVEKDTCRSDLFDFSIKYFDIYSH